MSHTIFDTWSFTRHFVTHHLSHTIFDTPSYTQLCHTPSFTHHLWHTIFDTPSFTPLCHTPSFTHRHRPSFTHHLWHMIFHTPLCHTPSFTHNLWHTILHTPSFTTPSFTHTTLSQTIFPPPPPLSFLPSPSPLQNLLIIIGRSWLVGLCGPLTFFSIRCSTRITDTQLSSMLQLEYFTRPFDVLHRSWTMLMLDKKTIAVCPLAATLIAEPQTF